MARTPATSPTGVANVVVWPIEHCSGVFKRVFGFTKVRYHGLKKNAHGLFVTRALVDLFMARKRLLRA